MKKNYLSKTAMSANPLAMIVAKKSWQNTATTWLLLLFTVFGFTDAFGQIVQRGGATTALSTANTITIAKPTGVVAGDIMIANIASLDNNNLAGTNANMTGWTLITASNINANNQRRCTILYKIAGAVEPTDYTFNVSNGTFTTDNTSGAIIAYSGVNNTTPFDVTPGTMSTGGPNSTVTASAITTVTANAAVIFLSALNRDDRDFGTWTTGTPSNLTLTETYDYSPTNHPGIGSAWAIQSTPGSTGAGSCTLSGNSQHVGILIALRPQPLGPPTITSFTPTSACASSSQTVVITGTNFIGATAVTIGGTAAASYVVNSATQITATIGTGATGTIQVTTPGGSATSATNFTVNPLPANPGNPTSNSPQCNPPGVTLTRTGTPPAGETWYWQTVAGGTSTANSAATFVATTSGTYYLRAQNDTTGCWSAGSGSLAITITPSLSAIAGTPAPTNAATGICYSGGSPLTDLTWNAVAGATSYDVYFGAGSLPGTAIANVTTNSYTLGTLSASTTYYWQVVPRNACGATSGTPATWTFTTAATPCTVSYCASNATSTIDSMISNVTFNTINNSSAACTGYTNFTAISTTVTKTLSYNLTIAKADCDGGTNYTGRFAAWIDWNQNGTFEAGEQVLADAAASLGPITVSVTVPAGALTGATRMRCVFVEGATAPTPCGTYSWGETEDYTVNVIDPTPCTTPTAQPTALNFSTSGTTISGSFTAASPAPNSYLVIISTSAVPPTPINGTTYTLGSTVGTGYTVVDNDSDTNFTANGLTPLTTYYFYVYSYNNFCSGGPLYLTTSPLTGNSTTTLNTYCTPTSNVSTRYIENVLTVGNITNISNLGTGRAPSGYTNYTSTTPVTQIPGGGVAIDYRLAISRQYVKIWVDWNNDGTFTNAAPELVYTTGGVQTIAGTGGFVVPLATLPGNYRIRIRSFEASQTFGPCGNLATGETEDYTLTVVADCLAKPTVLHHGERCGNGTVVLGVEGSAGVTHFLIYDSLFGGTQLGNIPAVPGITNWTTPSLTSSKTYYVAAFNGTCESWYRQEIEAVIKPISNIVVTPSVPEVCGENNVVQITAGGDFIIDYLVNENFEGGSFGVLTSVNPAANVDTQWTNRTSPYVPVGAVWKPAITSKAIGNRFACANSDFGAPNPKDTQLRTANLNTTAYSDLYLSFRHYFSYYPGEPVQFADVDVSTDGGTGWTNIARYTSNQGYAGEFTTATLNLTAYAGMPQVMIRFRFNLAGGSAWADGWALDDVKVYGTRPLNTTFTWTGGTVQAFTDAACLTPYVSQSVTTVYVRPTPLQLASPSWSFTANATLGNLCTISKSITITNKTKLWKGTVDNNWYNPNNWSPTGVPDANTCVYIYPGSPAANTSNINTIANDAFAKVVTVRPSGVLNIHPNNDLTVTDAVTVDAGGTFNIESTGSLIQVNNVANSGIISMKRNATIKALDYVYWSSPVASFASNAISPATPTSLIWKWEPTTATAYASQFGNWVNGVETMSLGRGYIVRSPNGWPSTPSVFTANFVGVPNNGNITRPITRSTYTGSNYTGPTSTQVTANDDNWNLLGNPYPSAISADAFLTANLTHINPFVDLWKHGNAPAAIASPFYQNYQLNYNPNDYLRYNRLGGTQYGFDGKIGAGQGFFVLMRDAGGTTENAIFNNSMRSNTHRNDQFFRTTESNVTTTDFERHRIWLMMVAPNLVSSDILVGYATGAQNNFDEEFDAMNSGVKVNYELYSLAENQGLSIQGRSLPFDTNDQIPLGVKIAQNGIHTIAISAADGLFGTTTQDIYLEDRTLGITHDLRTVPYSFTAAPGTYENRFVLKFSNETLGNEDFTANAVTVYTDDNINVTATNQTIKSVRVHDLLGKVIGTFNNVNAATFSTRNVVKTQSPILVEVTLENGATKTYKVIF